MRAVLMHCLSLPFYHNAEAAQDQSQAHQESFTTPLDYELEYPLGISAAAICLMLTILGLFQCKHENKGEFLNLMSCLRVNSTEKQSSHP